MHILLLSANTGEGHNSTSKAIMDVLRAQGHSCEMQDVLAFLSPRFSKFICNWHSRIYKYMPKLFDAGYGVMERNVPDPEESTPVYELLSLGAYKLYQMLLQKDFDSILCVHPFAGVMMTEVRKDWNVTVPCYFVATDYTCCPTVEQCRLDGYFIPDPALIPEFVQAGLPEDKLFPLGIPVRQSFYQKNVQYQAKSRLGLPVDGCVILLMCGSMGCGPIRRVAKALAEQLPGGSMVVAICGRNTKLQEDLLQFSHPNLRVLGFVEDIPGYMDAADIIVTKPGGLSSTEAANKHLPMVLINTIGGCESRNFDFFLSRGYALGSSNADEVIRQTVNLAANRSQQRLLHQTLSQRFHINSAQEIAQQVLTGAARYRNLPQPDTSIIPDEAGHPIPEKEGCNMDNQPKQTINNLARSFAGESQARTRYSIYAQIARKEGFEWIARVFEETAANEAVHAEEFWEHLETLGGCASNIEIAAGYPYQLGTTAENLQFAAEGELNEHASVYPQFAELARREGFNDTARLWMQIARIEGVHHNTFRQLHEQLTGGTLTEKPSPITWRCLHCGYTYEGIRCCDPCPVCGKEAGWQAGQLDSRMLMKK